jgi:5-methylthioadenosine/S-adenosylhomocysteine deaminase
MLELGALDATDYALAPDILLTPEGPCRDRVLRVQDGRIAEIARLADFERDQPGRTPTRLPGRAIIPGFVDAHIHLSFAFGKSLIGGEPSQIWQRIWNPLEQALDPEACHVAAKWSFLEALRGGYTTVVNFVVNDAQKNAAVHAAARETGIRLVSCTGVDERIEQLGAGALDAALARAEQHVAQCAAETLISPSICCGGFVASFPDIVRALGRYSAERGVLFQLHSNEHFPEVHSHILKFGKRPIELWDELGILGPHTLLHHAALTSEREIELLHASGTAISYNPVASQWKGNGVAPALRYAARGIRMGLGTDSTRQDGFRTMDAAESCQRIAHAMAVIDFSCGAGWTWVDAATRGGADACGLSAVTGALTAGHAADFLILDMDRPEVIPSWDFEWELVRSYNRDQIDAVVIAGKRVMQAGHAVGWDQAQFMRDYAAFARRTVEAAGIVRVHGPSTRHRARPR